MLRRLHRLFVVILLIGLAVSAILWRLPFNQWLWTPAAVPWPARLGAANKGTAAIAGTVIKPEALAYLAESFCNGDLCRSGSWAERVIVSPDSVWSLEELQVLHSALTTAIGAFDETGLDGRALLSGYRFRRSQGTYLPGKLGQVALVQHDTREIWLADRALFTQSGFHIYHELGHVVDRRLEGALTREFQRLTLGEEGIGSKKTADGFWLDRSARDRPQEATADAFALWVILNHTSSPEPVFWTKPENANYKTIAEVLGSALRRIARH